MKLDFESCLDVSKLDVWLDVFNLKLRARWPRLLNPDRTGPYGLTGKPMNRLVS